VPARDRRGAALSKMHRAWIGVRRRLVGPWSWTVRGACVARVITGADGHQGEGPRGHLGGEQTGTLGLALESRRLGEVAMPSSRIQSSEGTMTAMGEQSRRAALATGFGLQRNVPACRRPLATLTSQGVQPVRR
jgi:hypothetical protein